MATKFLIGLLLAGGSLLLQACGANSDIAIATGLAQTVQVRDLQTAAAAHEQTTQPSAATETPGVEVEAAVAATPAPTPDWEGSWQIWLSGYSGEMTIYKSGRSIRGEASTLPSGGIPYDYSFTGTISEDGLTVAGTFLYLGPPSGTLSGFVWHIEPGLTDQFRGSNLGFSNGEWCGQRNNAPLPVPCIWP